MEIKQTKKWIENALLNTERSGMPLLLDYMEQSGFYTAPCSTTYHLAKEGGLAEHSLNVSSTMFDIAKCLLLEEEYRELYNSIAICGLLHDLGKMGQYGKANYTENILKSGKISEKRPYVTNSDLLSVPHEVRSIVIASQYIQLTEDEQFAILYHNGMYGDLKYALKGHETKLYLLLHYADMWCSHVTELDGTQEDERES